MMTASQAIAQHKIGLRAGLNRSIISAENLEEGEDYSSRGGFHFGVNYTYQVAPRFGIRGELLFTQRGSKFTYSDDNSYTAITPIDRTITPFFDFGQTEVELELSNGYLSVPITAQFQITPKIELFGGASVDFLLNPTGRGTLDYVSNNKPDDIFFLKSYDHSYRTDTLGQIPFGAMTTAILVNSTRTDLIRTESAYLNLQEGDKDGTKFNFVDAHVIVGANYFINNGFYIGLRYEYGLFDITNTGADFTLEFLDENENYIRREDSDFSRAFSLSIGFRF